MLGLLPHFGHSLGIVMAGTGWTLSLFPRVGTTMVNSLCTFLAVFWDVSGMEANPLLAGVQRHLCQLSGNGMESSPLDDGMEWNDMNPE